MTARQAFDVDQRIHAAFAIGHQDRPAQICHQRSRETTRIQGGVAIGCDVDPCAAVYRVVATVTGKVLPYGGVVTAAEVIIKVRSLHIFDVDQGVNAAHAVIGGASADGSTPHDQALGAQIHDHCFRRQLKTNLIKTAAAVHAVIARAAIHRVIAAAAGECVVAKAAIHLTDGNKFVGSAHSVISYTSSQVDVNCLQRRVVAVVRAVCAGIVTVAGTVAAVKRVVSGIAPQHFIEGARNSAAQAAACQGIVASATGQKVDIDQGIRAATPVRRSASAQISRDCLCGSVVGVIRDRVKIPSGAPGNRVIAGVSTEPFRHAVAHRIRHVSNIAASDGIGSAGARDLFDSGN